MATAEQATDPHAHHGEGPVWFSDPGELRFVDMLAGDICTVDNTTRDVSRLHIGEVAAAFRPRTSGGMVAAIERGFASIDADGTVHRLGELWSDPGIRMNEGACDPDGRFYCGSMAYAATPGAGTLWRLDTDGTTSVAIENVTISNGLIWTPDGGTAYYIDTPTKRVDAFDYDTDSGLTNRRPAVTIQAERGGPDGMTLDTDGYLWVAIWGGSAVHRYAPDGRLDEVVELPVSRVSACTFGGPELDELFITTSRQGLEDPTTEPAAGAIFSFKPGVSGLPILPYAG